MTATIPLRTPAVVGRGNRPWIRGRPPRLHLMRGAGQLERVASRPWTTSAPPGQGSPPKAAPRPRRPREAREPAPDAGCASQRRYATESRIPQIGPAGVNRADRCEGGSHSSVLGAYGLPWQPPQPSPELRAAMTHTEARSRHACSTREDLIDMRPPQRGVARTLIRRRLDDGRHAPAARRAPPTPQRIHLPV